MEHNTVRCTATTTYDPEASEYRPRLARGHPYRTTTRFIRDDAGKLIRDVDGFLVPLPHEKDEPRDRSTTWEEREATRQRVAIKAEEERKAIRRMARRIKKRQDLGDPDCRPSENEDFPLLAVLRRDKRPDTIAAVLAYRQLVALCEAEPLKGQTYGQANGVEREYETRKMRGIEEVDAAAAVGFTGGKVLGGEIVYERRVRKSEGAYDIPAKRILSADVDEDGTPVGGKTESLHIKLNEDTIADYIDAKPRLARIRYALGPLLDQVEDVVLGGQTLESIGKGEGFSGSSAAPAGKAVVYRGLAVLDSFLVMKKQKPANDNYLISNRKSA